MLKYLKLTCDTCGKQFERYDRLHESNIAKGHTKINCSKSCAMKGNKRSSVDCSTKKYKDSFEKRFWKKVDKTGDCWLWTAGITQNNYGGSGYGKFYTLGKRSLAHRVAYELTHGPIPDGMVVSHLCNNRRCVNPNHLTIGTQKENVEYCMACDRHSRGSRNHTAKLDESQVKDIKELLSFMSMPKIAAKYNVSISSILRIKNGKGWKHVS